ncbi:MAG: sulfatase-like hydrolase/transferase [Rhizobiaceae bacterium]|nr:sulfatase-like hydrolase/transferase [Rhizobiaceae bacterium]
MKVRPFLRQMALLLTLSFAGVVTAATAVASKPNILLVITDDMGLDASNCYAVGNSQAPMPNLERLCAQGLVFDNAYAAPVCSPTRATLMTGRYGFRTGVGTAITRRGGSGLSTDETSLFDLLASTDYAKAVIGKWHLAPSPRDYSHPAELGVDDYFCLMSGGIRDYYNWTAIENGRPVDISGYSTTVLTDRAVEWVGRQTDPDKPWFLWLAFNAPHTPFHVPPSDLHSAGDLADSQRAIRQNPEVYFDAALEALDTELGRLLASMEDNERAKTIVIFMGDNGSPRRVADPVFNLRGAKGSIFEGGTHVPLIIAGPGVRAGRTEALVNSTDLYATIASLAGTRSSAEDAIDFSDVLAGKEGTRSHVYVERFSEQPARRAGLHGWAIRDKRHKLVVLDDDQPMLFDLQSDPFEERDLLAGTGSPQAQSIADALEKVANELRN